MTTAEKATEALKASGLTQKHVAEVMSLRQDTLNKKLAGASSWKVDEALAFGNALGLKRSQIMAIFLTE